jgi:hypothetical protein
MSQKAELPNKQVLVASILLNDLIHESMIG